MSLIERIHWLDAAIRQELYPNPETLAAQFGVTPRTAKSDYAHLRYNLGAPAEFDRDRGGWHYTEKTFVLTSLILTSAQASALQRAVLATRTLLGEADAATLEKVIASASPLSPPPPIPAETVTGAVRLTYDIGAAAELLEDCRYALETRRRLFIRYYSPQKDEETERIVRPFHVMNHLGEHHLIAWCETKNAIRQFFIGRIREHIVLEPDHSYSVDPTFDAEEYQRGFVLRHGEEPVTVRIRFSPYQARWARERVYHSTQVNDEQADGGLIVTFHVAGIEEIRRWVLGFGPEAEALEPQALRDAVAEAAKKVAEIYEKASQ